MAPDLSKMDEVRCPDCGQPLFIELIPDQPGCARFGSCRCDRQVYEVPDCVMFGIQGGPLFLYAPRRMSMNLPGGS